MTSVSTLHSRKAACPAHDMVRPVLIRCSIDPSRPLLDVGHQRHPVKPRPRDAAHDLHHCTVIDLAVATDINALVEPAAARLGNGLELADQLFDPDFGVLKEDLALLVERKRQGLLARAQALALAWC